MEMALRIFRNFQQDDWSNLLPVIQYQLNSHLSNTTKRVPYETWMGYIPKAHQPKCDSLIPAIEERKSQLREAWQSVAESMIHAQSLWRKSHSYQPYHKGDRVWLEGTNLCTSHPTTKLRPKQFSPFEVLEELSSVTYRHCGHFRMLTLISC